MGLDEFVCDELGKTGNHKCPSIGKNTIFDTSLFLKFFWVMFQLNCFFQKFDIPVWGCWIKVVCFALYSQRCWFYEQDECVLYSVRLSLMASISVFSAPVHLSLSHTGVLLSNSTSSTAVFLFNTLKYDLTAVAQSGLIKYMTLHTMNF